ncbi:DUF302 domain-containing protein [Salisediminibacterium selenitireducens]|nr:DUF302 domain-containing protein [Salisediminibacterium selenitireducens]
MMTFDYTVSSDKPIETLLTDLEASLKDIQFGVLWPFNVKETLQNKGQDFDQDYYIYEVCNPPLAKKLLDRSNLAGAFLPCKLVIYESGDKRYITLPKPTKQFTMLDDPEIHQLAEEIEVKLIDALHKTV